MSKFDGPPQPHPQVLALLREGAAVVEADPEAALRLFVKALDKARALGDRVGEARALQNIGMCHHRCGRPQMALMFLQRALELTAEADDGFGEAAVRFNLATVHLEIATVHQETGQVEAATASLEQIPPLVPESVANQFVNAQRWVEILHDAGRMCRDMQHPARALPFYEVLVRLLGAVEDKHAAGVLLNNAGLFYQEIGQPRESLKLLHQALEMDKAAGNRRGEAATLNNIASVYQDVGEPRMALPYLKRALKLSEDEQDEPGQATILNNLAEVYLSSDKLWQPDEALLLLRQALALLRKPHNRHKRKEVATLKNIAWAYFAIGGFDKISEGMRFIEEAEPLLEELADPHLEVGVWMVMATLHQSLGDLDRALHLEQAILRSCRRAVDRSSEAHALSRIAAIKDAQGRSDEAERDYRAGLAIIEEMREDLGGLSRAKISFLGLNLDIYHSYVSYLLRHRREAEAFAWAQKIKARGLLDLMAGGKIDISQGINAQERQQEQEQELARRVQQLSLAGDESGLAQAQSERQAFLDRLYVRHPELALKRAAKTITLDEVVGFLPADAALLEYVALDKTHPVDRMHGSDRVVLFCVTKEGDEAVVKAYPIEKTREELEHEGKYFHGLFDESYSPWPSVVDEPAQQFYEWLLAPAAEQLAGKTQLIVCPDGPLWGLPFHALRTASGPRGDEQFLVEQFEISYAYSATAAGAAARSKDARAANLAGTMMVMALSQFSFLEHLAEEAGDGPRSSPIAFSPLPNTLKEVEAIQASFPDAIVRIEAHAQKAVALREAGRFRYLHFATHGLLHDVAPLESSIVLAAPAGGSLSDSLLTAREIFDLNWNAEMVVLSACDTGRGQQQSGEGIIGLTWALFVAGAPTQVVSQWKVDDARAVDLMGRFYAGIRAGKPKGAALREATLALIKDENGERVHPFYWAPFVLMGDPR